MDLDISASWKTMKDYFRHYIATPSDKARKDLERELDLLIGISYHGPEQNLKELFPQPILLADCLSILVSILNDVNLKSPIQCKAMIMLSFLALSKNTRKSLQESFKLPLTLTSFLNKHSLAKDETVVLQGLQLLQQVTYGIQVKDSTAEFVSLIKYLVSTIVAPDSSLVLPCLGSIASICRCSVPLQDYLRNMVDARSFVKKLTGFLNERNNLKLIHAVSVLLIFINHPFGTKIFSPKNIDELFEMIFSGLLKGNGKEIKRYSCDLFIDLLRCPRIQKYLDVYTDLPSRLKEVVRLLRISDADSTEKILEIFLELLKVPSLRGVAVDALLLKSEVDGSHTVVEGTQASAEGSSSFSAIINLVSSKHETEEGASMSLALQLIKELCTIISSNSHQHKTMDGIDLKQLLPALLDILTYSDENNDESDPSLLIEVFQNIHLSLEILIHLCKETTTAEIAASHLDVKSLSKLLFFLYERFSSSLKYFVLFGKDYSQVISSAVIGLIELIVLVETRCEDDKESTLHQALQSPNLMPFLANGLSSKSEKLIQSCIQILCKARNLQGFSITGFSGVLAANSRPSNSSMSDDGSETAINQCNQATPARSQHEQSPLISATTRAVSALEIRERDMFELSEIYERKLASARMRENHLKGMIDSKTNDLANTNALLAEYRRSSADSDAECRELRSLLLQSQKHKSRMQAQMDENRSKLNEMDVEIQKLCEIEKNLLAISEENEQRKNAYQDQTDRLLTAQESLLAAEEEHATLSEMNEMLRSRVDNLKIQYDCSQQQLKELEKENEDVSAILKDKDKKYDETKKELDQKIDSLLKENRELSEAAKEREKMLEDQNRKLKRNLQALETENRALSDMNAVLQKQGENSKAKFDGVLQQYKKMEKEMQANSCILKEKEKKYEVAKRSAESLKEELKSVESKRLEFEKKSKTSDKQMKQLEKAKSDLTLKVTSLTALIEKYEKQKMENQDTITKLETDLKQHAQLSAMIHNMTGGKR